MFDFRLRVFQLVAKRKSFTKAAEELYITQPAVSKHIKEIESYYKVKLFHRNGSKIVLTEAGHSLLGHVDELLSVYHSIEIDMHAFSSGKSGHLRIGASTTIAEYILPTILPQFHSDFKDIKVSLKPGNSEQIEMALAAGEIDLGIIEGQGKSPDFKYTPFLRDEIVLVARANHYLIQKESLALSDLATESFLLREPGSGTLAVIANALKLIGIKLADLHVEMQLRSSESIKNYLLSSNTLAFLSVFSILKELKNNECAILDIKGLSIERDFCFIQPHGEYEMLPALFIKFALEHNFR